MNLENIFRNRNFCEKSEIKFKIPREIISRIHEKSSTRLVNLNACTGHAMQEDLMSAEISRKSKKLLTRACSRQDFAHLRIHIPHLLSICTDCLFRDDFRGNSNRDFRNSIHYLKIDPGKM